MINYNGCPYCKGDDTLKLFPQDAKVYHRCIEDLNLAAVFAIVRPKGAFDIYTRDGSFAELAASFHIRYCPVCGRDFEKEADIYGH